MYQQNVYAEGSAFHSFKKVMTEIGAPYNGLEVASFMTCSKKLGRLEDLVYLTAESEKKDYMND